VRMLCLIVCGKTARILKISHNLIIILLDLHTKDVRMYNVNTEILNCNKLNTGHAESVYTPQCFSVHLCVTLFFGRNHGIHTYKKY
jgi:hypothetical protein